jgi:magnesium transporter
VSAQSLTFATDMNFKISREYIENIRQAVRQGDAFSIENILVDLHSADIAEIFESIEPHESKFILDLLDEELAAEVLTELEEEVRERLLKIMSSKEIAEQLEQIDSDDAADILGELSEEIQQQVISQIEDEEIASEVIDLLNYDEDTAGGLMQKEIIKARLNWTVLRCVAELRRQAENVEKVYTIYVVDDKDKLVGFLSLKKLLFAKPKALVEDLFTSKKIISVKASEDKGKVANLMRKYNLESVPVVDLQGKLIGRITIDDIIDVIQEEAEKDYQMASGISGNIEARSSIFKISRARLPWLIIALFGGLLGTQVIKSFEPQIEMNAMLAIYITLIPAMAGNVGVQSSAIVVQGLANNTLRTDDLRNRLMKEIAVALLNGIVCASIVFILNYVFYKDINLGITVSVALMTVILQASIMGTIIPLGLNKIKIDPALATGPFITTMNDVVGLFIYFTISIVLYT